MRKMFLEIGGTFKYHMTLREGVCSNRQECRHMGVSVGQIVI